MIPSPITTKYDDLRKEVAQRYEKLHPDVKAALVSVDTAGAVYEIGKKFGFNIEKTGYLADVIGYTIIGLLPVADFINNIKDMLGVDNAKAEEIAREVNMKIFLAIRDRLKEMHGEKWDERAMTATQETRSKNQEARTETPTTESKIKNQESKTTPTTPKSPWEIRPDGFRQETQDARHETLEKSVIPPTSQPTTNNRQPTTTTLMEPTTPSAQPITNNLPPTTSPETAKTREAPQPTPATGRPEVLREIRPLQQLTTDNRQPITNQQPTTNNKQQTTASKVTPPTNLPFMKEVEKLTQTPELQRGQPTTNNRQPTTPLTKPTINSQQPTTTTPTIPAQKYSTDPYREPIE
jgi:predicted RNA-binding protein with RPS1 domain